MTFSWLCRNPRFGQILCILALESLLTNGDCRISRGYHGVGKFYLINSKKLQIGIGIGKFSIINY